METGEEESSREENKEEEQMEERAGPVKLRSQT